MRPADGFRMSRVMDSRCLKKCHDRSLMLAHRHHGTAQISELVFAMSTRMYGTAVGAEIKYNHKMSLFSTFFLLFVNYLYSCFISAPEILHSGWDHIDV
jgi:hypothetical protein